MTLKPKFKITNKILDNISQITVGREIIENSRLIPKWELKLQKEARVHNAHSSTSIEGNRLSLDQVKALSENKEVTASAKDKQEVINYLQALDLIPEFAQKKIDTKLFLKIHKIITAGTLKNKNDSGTFRNQQVFVGRRVFDGTQIKNVVEYMPPDTKRVPGLVDEFLEWLESKAAVEINPVLLAGITHYEIARIHPFIDGNGRTARLLATLILYKRGFDHRRFFALDDYYDEERQAYYAALKTVDKNQGDLTRWLEYFTEGVLHSVNKVKETINKIGLSSKISPEEIIELSQRQIKILEALKTKKKISNRELRNLFKISRQAMLKEITKLTKAGLVILVGIGRNAYYRIVE